MKADCDHPYAVSCHEGGLSICNKPNDLKGYFDHTGFVELV